MDHDIFISHASKDKSTADAVCASLEQEGIRCWIASRDILPGSEWAEAILNAIAVARVMVIVFSSDSNVSMQVKQEVTQAIDKGLILVVFRIEDVLPSGTLELYVRPWHWLDAFTHTVEGHIHHVVQVVGNLGRAP